MRLRVSLSTGLALFPVLLVLLAVGLLGWRYTSELKADQQGVNHSEAVLDAAQAVLLDVEDAETSQRGFIITGREPYLDLYTHAVAVLPADLAWLEKLTPDEPAPAGRAPAGEAPAGEAFGGQAEVAPMAALRIKVNNKMMELAKVIAARRRGGYPAAAAIINSDVGFHDMQQIRTHIGALTRDEVVLQHRRNALALQTGEAASLIVLLATVAGLTVTGFLGMRLVREEKLRAKAAFAATIAERDLTARQLKEQELAHHISALERSNRELDEFAHIASHDLKEPLRGLFNNAKFLIEDYSGKLDLEGVNRLSRLGYLCQRMELLINDLLYFSRLGRQELAIQPSDLNAVIRDIATMSETILQERNAVIVVPRELPRIRCDKTRIAEVFRNLIINAVKYNESAAIRVEIGCLDDLQTKTGIERNVFYVKDNGIGIAEEFYEDVFGIFKRLNPETDDKKGTGVGLTFVRKIIERHGGRVWLDSVPTAGSIFYFTIGQGQVHDSAA